MDKVLTDIYNFIEEHNLERIVVDTDNKGFYEVFTNNAHLPFLIKDYVRAHYQVNEEHAESSYLPFKEKKS